MEGGLAIAAKLITFTSSDILYLYCRANGGASGNIAYPSSGATYLNIIRVK